MAGQNPANGRNRGRPRECTAPRRAWSGRIWGRGGPHDAFDLQAWLSLDLNRAVIEIGDDHPRAPAGPGQHEHRGRGSPGRGDRIHPDWTEHVERRRQCVGVGGRFSDHCGGDHTLCGEATSRVEDVAEFATAVDEELRARPACAECLVIERDRGEPPSGPQRMPEAHPPAVAVTHRRPLRAPREHAALPPVHEHAGRPASREACDRTVERPALADGAGIDLDARPEKPHAAPLDVKLHMLHAGGRAGSGECGVVGRAALASQEPPSPHERPRGEIKRLDFIVEKFLNAVRPVRPVPVTTDLNELIQEAMNFIGPEVADRRIAVTLDLAEGLPLLHVDQDQLKQVLYNLVRNSCQAMGSDGEITVRTGCDDENVFFTIADNGPGIPADQVSRVFEPYYTTKKTGSGLGLLIVHRIVHDHGGEVEFKSREGLGTEVTVYLPRAEKLMRFLPSKSEGTVIDVEVEG